MPRSIRRGLVAILGTCLLGSCAPGAMPKSVHVTLSVSVWASSIDQSRKLARLPSLPLVDAGAAQLDDVVVDLAAQGQEIVGFGAAMTDASAQLIQNVLPPAERGKLLAELFRRDGLGLSFVRVPIGASDFSSEHYSLNDMSKGQIDPALKHFSMVKAEAAQLPALRAAKALNPDLTLMASPWSAPGWMKTTDSLIQGRLKAEHYGAFAAYFVRYLNAMEAAGLPVRYITAQNEPDFEPSNYPGMRLNAPERAHFIARYLGPSLAARRQKVGILDWDHNWDKPEEPLAVLADSAAAAHVEGVAWHCYGGDPAVMARVKAAHPGKELFFTECSGGEWSSDWGGTLEWMTDNLVIATIRAGGKGSILWNLALDQSHGPHLGGCGNCRAVVTIDTATRAVTRNVEYYVLAQVSRFVRPGARAIISGGGPSALRHVAFRNRDGSVAVLAHNSARVQLPISVKIGKSRFSATMPPGEVMTFVWQR